MNEIVERWVTDESIDRYSLEQLPVSITVADPRQPDMPLVFVNAAFEQTTGYSSDEVIGRNCRFLQGEKTDKASVAAIRSAIEEGRSIEITLLNYRKDGSTFWNDLHLAPLRNASHEIVYLVGIQKPVGDPNESANTLVAADLKLQEIQHRVKNHLAMVVSLIRMHAHSAPPELGGRFDSLSQRVESLQLLYEQLTEKSSRRHVSDNRIQLDNYLARIVKATVELDPDRRIKAVTDVEKVFVSVDLATHLGMLVSEIVTNALQHAFKGRDSGLIGLRVMKSEDGAVHISVSDNGVGLPADVQWPSSRSLGGRIIKSMSSALGARTVIERENGTTFKIMVPLSDHE